MTAGTAHASTHPADLLLAQAYGREAPAGDVQREAAELTKCVADAPEELCVLRDEMAGAVVAAGLLVREDAQQYVAARLEPALTRSQHRGNHHRDATLHVKRAATPNEPTRLLARERRPRPVLIADRHDVDVALQQ